MEPSSIEKHQKGIHLDMILRSYQQIASKNFARTKRASLFCFYILDEANKIFLLGRLSWAKDFERSFRDGIDSPSSSLDLEEGVKVFGRVALVVKLLNDQIH